MSLRRCRDILRRGEPELEEARRDRGVHASGAAADAWPRPTSARGRGRDADPSPRPGPPRRAAAAVDPARGLARLAAMPKAPVLALILVGLVGGAVVGRERIVAAAPRRPPLCAAICREPARPRPRGVRSELVLNGSDQLLVVEGEILNRAAATRGPVPAPDVRGPTGSNFTPGRTSRRARHWRRPRPRASGAARVAAGGRPEVLVRFAHAAPDATVAATAP